MRLARKSRCRDQTARMPQKQQASASGACQGELKNLGLCKAGIWRMSLQRALAYGDPHDRPYAVHDPCKTCRGRQHQHPDARAARSSAAADIWLIEKDGAFRRGKQAALFVPTSAPTAYGVIE